MRSFTLASVFFASLALSTATKATEYKIDCTFGAKFNVVIPYVNGLPILTAPWVKGIDCRSEVDNGSDVFLLPGFPGEYGSLEGIKDTIDNIRTVLRSRSMRDVKPEALPPAMQFVKKLMDEQEAAKRPPKTN
jgi:hypothetical protein